MRKPRTLHESIQVTTDSGSTLRVDRDAGIIYGVRVLGRYSKNSHGADGAEKGTEYPPATQKAALSKIDGQTVRTDHPPRSNPDQTRSVFESFGILKGARIENRDGQDGIVADLHYIKEHPLAGRVLEDVERQLGLFGLSINAYSGKECVRNGFLVIEEISDVVGVDLVDRPATTRNLFESLNPTTKEKKMKTITLRKILERLQGIPARKGGFTPARSKWAKKLLEADDSIPLDMAAEMPTATGDADDDPDTMMAAAFRACCIAVLDSDADLKTKLSKIKDILTTEEKLLQKDEPAEPTQEEEEDDEKKMEAEEEDDDEKKKAKQESKAAKKPAGKSLQEDADAKELAKLRKESKTRTLCESLEFRPSGAQLKALVALETDKDRTDLINELKGSSSGSSGTSTPRSLGGWTNVLEGQAGKDDKKPMTMADEIAFLRS